MKTIDLLKLLLKKSAIKRQSVNGFDKYTVFNTDGSLFSIGFNSETNKHGFGRTQKGIKELAKYGINDSNTPDFPSIYSETKAQYQTNMVNYLFKTMIENHEIDAEETPEKETYTATNQFGPIFSFSHDKKANKYAIKREKQLKYLYEALELPFDIEPDDLKEMYKLIKAEYYWQVVRDNIESMYDFIPAYYNQI